MWLLSRTRQQSLWHEIHVHTRHDAEPGRVGKGGKCSIWIIIFDTYDETYVGKAKKAADVTQKEQQRSRHAWAAALIAREPTATRRLNGHDLYIMDQHTDIKVHGVLELTGAQRKFAETIRKRWKCTVEGAHITNVSPPGTNAENCLDLASRWMEQLVKAGVPQHDGGTGALEELLGTFTSITPT